MRASLRGPCERVKPINIGMRLTDLDAEFIQRSEKGFRRIPTKDGADGILFLCPECFRFNDGNIGTHSVICWAPHVPLDITPGPGRWELLGTSLDDLTLRAGSSSVLLTSDMDTPCARCQRKGACHDATCRYCPCRAHFYIRNGAIEMC